jgi:hypothetical protein
MEMVTANLVREGVNKHKARELAEHFYGLAPAAQQEHEPENEPYVSLASVQEPVACHICGGQGFIEFDALPEREKNNGKWGRCLNCQPYTTPPAQPAPVEPDWKAEYLKSVESGCITLDELREARAELDATNRQVEILSDALAESRREVTALNAAQPAPVQEPVGYEYHEYRPYGAPGEIRINAILKSRYAMPDGSTAGDYQWLIDQYRANINTIKLLPLYTTPPAAQPAAPLTDEQIESLLPDDDTPMSLGEAFVKFARLVEAAHGIKKGQQ